MIVHADAVAMQLAADDLMAVESVDYEGVDPIGDGAAERIAVDPPEASCPFTPSSRIIEA